MIIFGLMEQFLGRLVSQSIQQRQRKPCQVRNGLLQFVSSPLAFSISIQQQPLLRFLKKLSTFYLIERFLCISLLLRFNYVMLLQSDVVGEGEDVSVETMGVSNGDVQFNGSQAVTVTVSLIIAIYVLSSYFSCLFSVKEGYLFQAFIFWTLFYE